MFEPTAGDLMKIANDNIENENEKVKSKFTIVMATSKRARELVEREDARVVGEGSLNPLTIAIDEFKNNDVRILKENED